MTKLIKFMKKIIEHFVILPLYGYDACAWFFFSIIDLCMIFLLHYMKYFILYTTILHMIFSSPIKNLLFRFKMLSLTVTTSYIPMEWLSPWRGRLRRRWRGWWPPSRQQRSSWGSSQSYLSGPHGTSCNNRHGQYSEK